MEERKRHVLLSVRMGKREPFGPTNGVPDYLWPTLEYLLAGPSYYNAFNPSHLGYANEDALIHATATFLRVPATRTWRELINNLFNSSEEQLLDALDFVVSTASRPELEGLEKILFTVAHEYRVDFRNKRLIQRVDDSVYAAFELATTPQDEASERLCKAWIATYSRDRDPSTAAHEATAAVEAVCRPVISPNDTKATLGKMRRALIDAPSKWTCTLPGSKDRGPVEQFADALTVVGYAQDKHGGNGATVLREQSTAALLQAITVVAWVREDVLRRVGDE